jgi:hypothetical protein
MTVNVSIESSYYNQSATADMISPILRFNDSALFPLFILINVRTPWRFRSRLRRVSFNRTIFIG